MIAFWLASCDLNTAHIGSLLDMLRTVRLFKFLIHEFLELLDFALDSTCLKASLCVTFYHPLFI